MRVLVVTADASFAIGAARMHPDARVLVASPNQLPSRSVEAFDVAVIDAGSDARNQEIAAALAVDDTAGRCVLITEARQADGDPPSLSRPFTLDELTALLGLEPAAPGEDDDPGFLGRLRRRLQLPTNGGRPAQAPETTVEAPRVRAWPRTDVDRGTPADGFDAAIVAAGRLRDLLEALPPVDPVGVEARALADAARTHLEGQRAVVWLDEDDGWRPHATDGPAVTSLGGGHAVVSALAEDVSAVLLVPPGPAADLVGGEARAVAAAGVRYGGRFLGAVAVGGRGFTVADRDRLLALARAHAPRLALARALAPRRP